MMGLEVMMAKHISSLKKDTITDGTTKLPVLMRQNQVTQGILLSGGTDARVSEHKKRRWGM
jgi:hypothetical protein